MTLPPLLPSEADEQKILVRWLRAHGIFFHSTPNRSTSPRNAANLKALGMRPGYPDVTIDTPPPVSPGARVHIEMKSLGLEKKKNGGCSKAQLECHIALRILGDHVIVAHGGKKAIDYLISLGYGSRKTA